MSSIHSLFKSAVEQIMPDPEGDYFETHGTLSPEQFVHCGNILVNNCPSWMWDGGKKELRHNFLPDNKQFLYTTNILSNRTINKEVYNTMPEDLKNVVKLCCYSEITESLAEFNYRNTVIYKQLSEKYKVKFRMLPEDIIKAWIENSEQVIRDIASKDGISKKIYESWNRYRENSMDISKYYELGFLKSRKNFSKS